MTRIFLSWIADFSTPSHCKKKTRLVYWRFLEPLFIETHNLLNIVELLVGRDGHRLNQKLVAAACIGGGLLLHRLQEDGDFDLMAGLNTARVWSDAVPGEVSTSRLICH